MKKNKRIKLSIAIILLSFLQAVIADDTEIFLGSNSSPIDPKVLFIFDNSGSMGTSDINVSGSNVSRISVVKKALLDIIHDTNNSDLDIGLMLFNKNNDQSGSNSNNGGRVVFSIKDITASNRGTNYSSYSYSGDGSCSWSGTTPADTTLTKKICDIGSDTNTPLEETLYESYLYYRGLLPVYGDQNRNSQITPLEDSAARASGTYYSPILEDASFQTQDNDGNGSININDLSCETANIVLMTDGSPYQDDDAHTRINTLTSDSNCITTGSDGNCLDELSKYMFENDLDGLSSNDTQNIITHTVGFTTNQTLLQDTATNGGGEYYTANNASELQSAFEDIFGGINDATASFSSPGSASSSTNDARSLDYIYSNVFKPASTPRWSGNLKKYRLDTVQNGLEADGVTPILEFKVVDVINQIVYDQNGQVISIANGNTDGNGNNYDVQSIWSFIADTDIVELGGAGASIDDYTARTVYTHSDTDSNSATVDVLTSFNTSNTYLSFSQFNAADDNEKNTLINWALGQDINDDNADGSTTDTRWVMGDTLHSQPTIINYGKRNNLTEYAGDFSDIRIAMGTNAGFLHLFKDDLGGVSNASSAGHTTGDLVEESWAFIPTQLLDNIIDLKTNNANTSHPYGIDGEIAVYQYDANQDGNIVSSEGDQVIIVFGMRRGGNYYYALDITDPDSPVYLWKFTHSEILQSWSKPEFGKIKYFDGSAVQTKTVAIVSAGYDTDKDAKATVGSNDNDGRGLFIVDLSTGELLWSVVNGSLAATATTLYESTLNDSIPATPRTVDINDDGILDRIYMADTGGNVWRIDLFNQDVKTAYSAGDDSRKIWSIYKLANLGRGDGSGLSNDRRFFNQIDFVQTRDSNGSFDALLLGSGHRNNPNETATQNRFYMLKDPNVIAYKFKNTGDACLDSTLADYDPYCKEFPATLTNTSLTDVSTTALTAYSSNGWRMDLGVSGNGEKSLSSSVTINGSIVFTTYSPTVSATTSCTPQIGSSYTYGVALHTASASYDFDGGGIDPITDRKKTNKQPGIPGKPGLYSPDGKKLYIVPGLGEEPMFTGNLQTQIHYWFKNSE